ncbi:branched-chain amino acid ABC transporter permease [Microtetraspora malaysiensis]|uniref:branched-chain amino acid ABC transporter permease n=1 Tax=Microtetraspora malaysiensis TaxID=161358 RepID=UPI003D935E43
MIVVALAYPFLNEPPAVERLGLVLVLSIAVVGLNLLTGYTNQISIGHSAFFGVGAYADAILVSKANWPHVAALPVGFLLACLAGVVCGLPALRIRGIHLAVVTLAVATVFPAIVTRFEGLTGGSQGIVVPALTAPSWTGLADDQFAYLVALAVLLISMLVLRNIVSSKGGRALVSLSDNEMASQSMGVNVAVMKVTAFGLSAGMAGVAGGLFAATHGFVSSQTSFLTLLGSIQFLTAMVVGGVASFVGPVIGTYVTQLVPDLLSQFSPGLSQVLYGVLLVLLMLIARDGLVGLAKRAFTRLKRSRGPRDALGPSEEPAPPRAVPVSTNSSPE